MFLNEVTRKIKTHLNDKRIARQCAKREGKAAKSRQWCPSADMWLKGTVAVETAAPVQDEEAAKPKVRQRECDVTILICLRDGCLQDSSGRLFPCVLAQFRYPETASELQPEEPQRFCVIKDDSQTTCAISHEPFEEEWDADLQEWVYVNAVRLPEALSKLPEIGLPPGSIVKVALLDPETCKLLGELNKKSSNKRQGDHASENGYKIKRTKVEGFNDSDGE